MMRIVFCLFAAVLGACVARGVAEQLLTKEELAEALKRSLPLGEGESVDIRFECSSEVLEERWKTLSLGCFEFLTTQQFSSNASRFSSSMRGLCTSCGEPLYRLVRDCVGGSRRYLRYLDVFCATNELGITCYDAFGGRELFSDCSESPCSVECKQDLVDSNQRHGCCMFSAVSALSDPERAERLWRRCDVEPPKVCDGAFVLSTSPGAENVNSTSTAVEIKVAHGTFLTLSFFSVITIFSL